jgi:hypothetical protein
MGRQIAKRPESRAAARHISIRPLPQAEAAEKRIKSL